ncbi:MAG: ABC transporter permease subunit [Clostridia bacterium]|nr:ABC transporter permease subunit [Clostridia bacterium]
MYAIFRRELASYFTSPVGYVVTAAFMVFNGIFFYVQCLFTGTSSMTTVFQSMFFIMLFLIPLITMRLFAEDKHNRTDQALLTSPVGVASIVCAKFLSALVLLLICLLSYVVDGLILSFVGSPDWGIIIGNMAAIALMGSSFIAIGLLISSLTESVVIAAVLSFAANVLISMLDTIASTIPWDWMKSIVSSLSFQSRYNSFALGIVSFSDIVFFLSITVLFLFLTDRMIDRRRWA